MRFERHLVELEQWLAQRSSFRVLQVAFARVHEDALAAATRVCDFLEEELDAMAMAETVDEKLYRQREK